MQAFEYHVTPAAVNELLEGDGHFVTPAALLEDLTVEQATTVLPGMHHSIAQIVHHMHYYQQSEIANIRQEPFPQPPLQKAAHLDDTFTFTASGDWPTLRQAFLSGLQQCKQFTENAPLIASESQANAGLSTSTGYDLAGTALHNAYHLGQIVLLRRMLGCWPPATGEPYDF